MRFTTKFVGIIKKKVHRGCFYYDENRIHFILKYYLLFILHYR